MSLSIHRKIQEIPYYPKAMKYGSEEGWIRLGSNENPYPPSDKVIAAIIDDATSINRYPGGELELKETIARQYGIKSGEVIIGNGSNELIETAMKGMRYEKRNGVIISEPSFAFYVIAAKIYGYETIMVPLKNMKVDLGMITDAIDDRTRMIILNNPLNPTGTIFEKDDFLDFLQKTPPDILLVIDEAYAEFVENPDFPDTIGVFRNHPILILRTFSKAYGLAGLRVGYGIGGESIIPYLERTKQPFSVNSIAINAAREAIADREYLERVKKSIFDVKKYMYSALKELSLEFIPTEANYVLVKMGHRAEEVTKRLFDEKIIVRWMGAYDLPEYIRITFGRIEENRLTVKAMERILNA